MAACHDQVRKGGLEGGSVKYLIVAEAYRDLEQASGRLVLIERMAELVPQTPAELLPTVCYLCQGQIAPEFAGIDLGLAEKMAIRALAAATGTETAQVAAYVRPGELHQAFSFDLLAQPWEAAAFRGATEAALRASAAVGGTLAWTLNNHDVHRAVSRYGLRPREHSHAADPMGATLRVMAHENRDMRMSEAEKKAAGLPPKLTVPMIVFFLPILFVVILGPAAIRVFWMMDN